MLEAVRLVREEEKTLTFAAACINHVKKNVVPRMTLSDRMKRMARGIMDKPALGRQQVHMS